MRYSGAVITSHRPNHSSEIYSQDRVLFVYMGRNYGIEIIKTISAAHGNRRNPLSGYLFSRTELLQELFVYTVFGCEPLR